MKRLTTLLLAAGLICSAFSAANAADIKAKGMWDFSFEYTNDSFDKHNSSDPKPTCWSAWACSPS